MKFKKLLIVSSLLLSTEAIAQSPDYKDLLTLFVSEKYEKCLDKAEGYTMGDDTKKDPIPFMYLSRCFFEMSKKDEFKEKYPTAFKDAMKYLSKYASKDKEKKYVSEYEDFFTAIRVAAISEAETMMDTQKYSKAKQLYDQLLDLDPNDVGAKIMMALVFTYNKSKKESEMAVAESKKMLTDKVGPLSKEQLYLLKDALSRYCSDNKAQAKEWLTLGDHYFSDDKEYNAMKDSILN
jgi:tetratricopeptide (TPR) repeat protein